MKVDSCILCTSVVLFNYHLIVLTANLGFGAYLVHAGNELNAMPSSFSSEMGSLVDSTSL